MAYQQRASWPCKLRDTEFRDDAGVALGPCSLCESSGARRAQPPCETASIFKVDCGSVKLPFRDRMCAAIKAGRLRRNLTPSWTRHTLLSRTMKTFEYASIAEITESVRSKTLSPVEIVNADLKRIEALQGQLNAFTHVDADGARVQA